MARRRPLAIPHQLAPWILATQGAIGKREPRIHPAAPPTGAPHGFPPAGADDTAPGPGGLVRQLPADLGAANSADGRRRAAAALMPPASPGFSRESGSARLPCSRDIIPRV